MEGLASNFEAVLKDFEEHLQGATYAAIDMELTGTDIAGAPDSYADSAAERLSRLCEVAETHGPIQIGITLVKHQHNCFQCTSYNFYAFPWVGPELLGKDPSFLCKATALRFNADKDHIDFNKWLKDAVPYMSREDEAHYLASPLSQGDSDLPRKVGLLRVWKLLCESRIPLVTHCPLDIFFLLSCFERRKLPRDPKEMAELILQCIPCIFDTAHLHGAIGGFRTMRLVKFLEDAQARHVKLARGQGALPCSFHFAPETARRYGSGCDLAHEAGFDSLCTAQLYAYLLNLSPSTVGTNVNRLFLFKSIECLDLPRAAHDGEPGASLYEATRESIAVARLAQPGDSRTLKLIAATDFVYKRMDSSHVLVTIRKSQSGAVRAAPMMPGVEWMSFEQWRIENQSSSSSHLDPIANQLEGDISRALTADITLDANASTVLDCSGKTAALTRDTALEATISTDVDASKSVLSWSSDAKHEPTTACSKALAWLDGHIEPRYRGFVKTFNRATGFGFISCPEAFAKFKRDVFLHRSQIANFRAGQEVSFTVSTNARGQPQAMQLRAADTLSWLDGDDCRETDVGTTVGASSDCASLAWLDGDLDFDCISVIDGTCSSALSWLNE